MIKLNDIWSIEHHKHGGFNLIETHEKGISKKTGKPIVSVRSYYYPKLEMCAAKMVEQNFDNEVESLMNVVNLMADFTVGLTAQLKEVMK